AGSACCYLVTTGCERSRIAKPAPDKLLRRQKPNPPGLRLCLLCLDTWRLRQKIQFLLEQKEDSPNIEGHIYPGNFATLFHSLSFPEQPRQKAIGCRTSWPSPRARLRSSR